MTMCTQVKPLHSPRNTACVCDHDTMTVIVVHISKSVCQQIRTYVYL